MFSRIDLQKLSTAEIQERYDVRVQNAHDITLHSKTTGHDWVIISGFDTSSCVIKHRHSSREPYHHQTGQCKSLEEALNYISGHDGWYASEKSGRRK